MKEKSKLILLLKALNNTEIRRLGELVHSPYFNKNKKVMRLFDLLKKKHPVFLKLDKEKLFFKVFLDKKKYHDGLFRALTSDLTNLVETFLAQQKLEKNNFYKDYWTALSFHERFLFDLFGRKLTKMVEHENQKEIKNTDYFYQKYLLDKVSYQHSNVNINRARQTSLQEVVYSLDQYYIADKIRHSAAVLQWERVLNTKYEIHMLKETLNFLEKNPFTDVPSIHLLHQLVLTYNYFDEESHYTNFKEGVLKYEKQLQDFDIRQFYTALLNYCRFKINQGKRHFLKESFLLYEHILEMDILTAHKYFSHNHFRNIVQAALYVKEYNWTEEFILSFKDRVMPKFRENVFAFSMAMLFFEKSQFEQAMSHLRDIQYSDIEFIDFYYHMYFKTLLIKTAFELDETELMFSTLEAFRIYLFRNKKVPTEYKNSYSNFIRLVRRIATKKMARRLQVDVLEKEIHSTNPLIQKDWLLKILHA